jgi:ABC-type dipeptide/oligopeptide/nickel transport system permease component
MIRFIVNRVLWAIPVLWLVATVTFFLMHAAPGSPWDAKSAGKQLDPSLEASFNRQYGLDKPLVQQYLIYLNNAVHLDFGTSYTQQGTSVEQIIMQGFPYSARIGLYALILSVLLGVPIGIIAALKQNTIVDYASLLFATIGYSLPSFVLAIFLLLLFAVQLQLIPVLFTDWRSYILPSVVLGLGSAAFLARLARASILEILRQDYVRTARAKGLSERTVVLKHALRNALTPVITLGALELGTLLSGAVLTEQVFTIPGFGKLIIDAVFNRDYLVVQGVVLCTATAYMVLNLLADLAYFAVNPRLRH